MKKLVDLRQVSGELESPVGKVKIRPDGTAVPLSDDPDEIAKIREFLRQAGVFT